MAIQVMIFTHFTCGKHGKPDLNAEFVCTFIFSVLKSVHMEIPTLKSV